MFTYTYDNGTLTLTNNEDVTVIQYTNPYTQCHFRDEEDALNWARGYANSFNDIMEIDMDLSELEVEEINKENNEESTKDSNEENNEENTI